MIKSRVKAENWKFSDLFLLLNLQKYKSNKFQKKANNINKIKKQGAKIEKQKNQN